MKIKLSIMPILLAALLAFAACKPAETPNGKADTLPTADATAPVSQPTAEPTAELTTEPTAEPTAEVTPKENGGMLVSYLIDGETIDEVCAIIKGAGLNDEAFRTAAEKYASADGMSACLTSGWIAPEEMKESYMDCADAWTASTDDADGNCRLTALLLLKNSLEYSELRKEYDGTYMMFDLDAIENSSLYAQIDPLLLCSLFGEWPTVENDHAATYAKNWTDSGFNINDPAVSLISIVFADVYDELTFVGHTGVLIKTDDSLVFIEKIAFEQPYIITKAENLEQIVDMLRARSDYQPGEGEPKPVIFENDRQIGSIG